MTNETVARFGYPDMLIKEYKNWVVLLRGQQVTLGSLVLCAKSEVTEFSALPADSYEEMGEAIKDIERVLKIVCHYEKINYLMLMMVDPNVHFHVIPRYSGERNACNLTISDSGWPGAPQLSGVLEVTSVERDMLCKYIRDLW